MSDAINSVGSQADTQVAQETQKATSILKQDGAEKTKSQQEIIRELKKNGNSSNMSVEKIAQKYKIPRAKAQETYDKLHDDKNDLTPRKDVPPPEGSSVSYHV